MDGYNVEFDTRTFQYFQYIATCYRINGEISIRQQTSSSLYSSLWYSVCDNFLPPKFLFIYAKTYIWVYVPLSKLDEKLRGQKIITGGATAPALLWKKHQEVGQGLIWYSDKVCCHPHTPRRKTSFEMYWHTHVVPIVFAFSIIPSQVFLLKV